MSTNYIKLLNNLETLKLCTIRDNLSQYIDLINEGTKTTVDALYELTEKEVDFKEKRAINACVHTAGFPYTKMMEDFDFNYQPSINKKEIEDYTTLRFMENNENILFIGSPKSFTRYKLLIIDEIGYINLDKQSANLFFQLISRRYEQRSTIITTNKSLSKWAEIFGDPVIANAILDRLLHHSHIVSIVGPSYRTKDVLDSLEE